jgi:alkylhydroperoxidase family enzyme
MYALLAFAEKCTRMPNGLAPSDLDALRAHGFSDSDLHDAVQVIGYFNHINRVAGALGIKPDAWLIEFEKELDV